MRDFPQELVDKVIDELFALVGRDNSYQGYSKRSRGPRKPVWGISDYSLVSRAWAGSTQKHHFHILYLDSPDILEKWFSGIQPDPTGVSRHVRKLALEGFDLGDFEDFEDHLLALTQVEYLTVEDCDCIPHHPSTVQWFLTIGSSLVDLRINNSPVAPHTITSLLAVLPLLQSLQFHNFEIPDDYEHEEDPPAPPRIPFFEGANYFALRSDQGHIYPEGSLDWIPASACFARLAVDMPCSLDHPDLVNQWLASSCATLTGLAIEDDPEALLPKEPRPLDLLPCTSLELLQIPISPFVETLLPHITSTQLATVILDLHGRFDQVAIQPGNRALDVIDKCLCPVAIRFNNAHPGRKMEVGITGYIGERPQRTRVLRTLNNEMFMPMLKKEAKFVIPPV